MLLKSNVEEHFRETEKLLRQISSEDVASWVLNKGYFPEQYILPPSFQVSDFKLQNKPYNQDLSDLARRKLINISHPKTPLTSRIFSIQHPYNYHDIVFYIKDEWERILDHLFHHEIKIYSYSLPIPITKKKKPTLTNLRSGRMIYEWLQMAEEDLVLDSTIYKFIARTDITNFYSSIYTHSIAWALEGRERAFRDKEYELLGNKIDRLYQYSNDGRTNGIPVGSILSDLVAEIILASIDRKISNDLKNKNVDFLAVRFKDDYRFICQSECDARTILKAISKHLSAYNLAINENKTSILKIPDGLYREHDRQYYPHSLSEKEVISFKVFEHTLLIALDIHRNHLGTSILEKFIAGIFTKDKEIKIEFSRLSNKRKQQIKKVISLLFLLKRESEKFLCHVLSVSQQLYQKYRKEYPDLKEYLKSIIKNEILKASETGSIFQIVWLIFFSRYMSLGIKPPEFEQLILNETIKNNEFYRSILKSKQQIFNEAQVELFKTPKTCQKISLATYLDVFNPP